MRAAKRHRTIMFSSLSLHPALVSALLLTASNFFMTVAWYGHLKNLQGSPWWAAAMISWGIAFFEYTRHTQLVADGQRDLVARSTS
jgi:uncharacterized protein (DUF486 family)